MTEKTWIECLQDNRVKMISEAKTLAEIEDLDRGYQLTGIPASDPVRSALALRRSEIGKAAVGRKERP